MYFVEQSAKVDSASDDSSSDSGSSESILDFNQLFDEEESQRDDEEEYENDEEEYEEDEDAHVDYEDDMPCLSDSVLRQIVPLIQRQVGYMCDLIYDTQHNILHISVPQGVMATWQVRKNMIQCLYSSLPMLRELLDQGALEISFTRGTRTLIEQSADELGNKDLQTRRSKRTRPRDHRSVNEEVSRDEALSFHQSSDESRDSEVEDINQGKSRTRQEIDFFAHSESRNRPEHAVVNTIEGLPPDYPGNLTRIEEIIARYKEQWFSEHKPPDDYDTWERLQDSKEVERIRAELARLSAVSVKRQLAQPVLTRDSKCHVSQPS